MIVIVGGYGAVGREIASRLARRGRPRVVLVGRDLRRAEACASRIGFGAEALGLDVDAASSADLRAICAGAEVVVMCAHEARPRLAQAAVAGGAHYVDVTADQRRLAEIQALDETARSGGATILVSVGLAPGLTNLLAGRVVLELGIPRRLDVVIVLAAIDGHGPAAIDWTLDNLDAWGVATSRGRPQPALAFAGRLRLPPTASRPGFVAYRFPFPEQSTLGRTQGVPDVHAWLALEPAVTGGLAVAARFGLASVLRRPSVRGTIQRIAAAAGASARPWRVLVRGSGSVGVAEMSATGRGQSAATAEVAVASVRRLVVSDAPHGVIHLDQLESDWNLIAELERSFEITTVSATRR